jgi:cobalamin biosynthesis Mg chelatase CobN
VIPPDTDAATQLARIEQLIERYREQKRRLLLRRALKLWRKTEADQRLAILELPPERVH